MKKCTSCQSEKELSQFRENKGFYSRWCNICLTEYEKVKAVTGKAPPLKERRKFYDIKKKYNISKPEYEQMLKKQNGKCAICKETLSKIVVDHCHETNIVRGLLCSKCNLGLGCFRDNKKLLTTANRYLNKTKKP